MNYWLVNQLTWWKLGTLFSINCLYYIYIYIVYLLLLLVFINADVCVYLEEWSADFFYTVPGIVWFVEKLNLSSFQFVRFQKGIGWASVPNKVAGEYFITLQTDYIDKYNKITKGKVRRMFRDGFAALFPPIQFVPSRFILILDNSKIFTLVHFQSGASFS